MVWIPQSVANHLPYKNWIFCLLWQIHEKLKNCTYRLDTMYCFIACKHHRMRRSGWTWISSNFVIFPSELSRSFLLAFGWPSYSTTAHQNFLLLSTVTFPYLSLHFLFLFSGNLTILSTFMRSTFLDSAYGWNHMVLVFLHLAHFTYHNNLQLYLYWCKGQNLIFMVE